MKKIAKRALAILVAATMAMSLTACGGNKNGASSDGAVKIEGAKAGDYSRFQKRDTMEISVATWNVGDAITSGNDPIRDKFYKKLNITIKPYQMTWGDYTQKISVWAASKNLPDLTCSDTAFSENFNKWVDGKVVAQVPDDLSAYPNLKATLEVNKEQAEMYKAKDGHYYGIPKVQTADTRQGIANVEIILRKDWAQKVGVTKSPETVDEFIDTIQKIQNSDPDGNGRKDTVGLTAYSFPWMTSVFYGSEPGVVNGYQWVWKDGKLTHGYNADNFLQAAKDINKMYKAGIIDPDLPSLKGEEGRDKFKNGKAAAYGHSNTSAGFQNLEVMATKNGKKLSDVLMNVYPFKNLDGNFYYNPATVYWSETYFKYGMKADKMDTCLALLDYMLSDEGHTLLSNGIEGEDYTKDADGNIVMKTDADGNIPDFGKKYPFTKIGNLAYWTGYYEDTNPVYSDEVKKLTKENYKWADQVGAKASDIPIVSNLDYPSKTKDTATAQNYQADILTLMKSNNVEADVAKIREKYKKAGGDQIEKELNEAASKAGLKPASSK